MRPSHNNYQLDDNKNGDVDDNDDDDDIATLVMIKMQWCLGARAAEHVRQPIQREDSRS